MSFAILDLVLLYIDLVLTITLIKEAERFENNTMCFWNLVNLLTG